MGDASGHLFSSGYMLLSRDCWLGAFEALETIESDFPASNDLVQTVRDELMQDAPLSWTRSLKNKTSGGGAKAETKSD